MIVDGPPSLIVVFPKPSFLAAFFGILGANAFSFFAVFSLVSCAISSFNFGIALAGAVSGFPLFVSPFFSSGLA